MEDKTPPSTNASPPAARTAESLRELQERARAALGAQRERMGRLEAQLTEQLDSIATVLAEQADTEAHGSHQAQQSLADATRHFESERAAWERERAALDEAKSALEQQRDELAGKVSQLTAEAAKLHDESARQVADFERQLKDQQAGWDDDRAAVEHGRAAALKERTELADAVARAGEELAAARKQAEAAAKVPELQQKFDLALEDVQRLRRRVAELEQDLAARPAVDESESVELVRLRSERDDLAERVAELEQQPAQPADGDAAQEMADLQRRFELAVEDVRDLKKTNSRLEAQLSDAQSRPSAAVPSSADGSSWEARKQQMLASLEDEGDDGDAERRAERATIENTIRITDDVVANKDRVISELKARLAEGGGGESAEEAAVRELIDADAVIEKHRKNIAQLESEMQDKLRAAELELSVERAKIAREQAQLGDLRAELESIRPEGYVGNTAGRQAPKRRWLSKLGLSGEDEGK